MTEDLAKVQRDLRRALADLKTSRVEEKRLRRALRIRILAQPHLDTMMSQAELLTQLIVLSREPAVAPAARPVLTARVQEVLAALVDGDTIREIAAHLYMGETTTKNHVSQIYRRLGVHNRAGACMAAVRHGFVQAEQQEQEGT